MRIELKRSSYYKNEFGRLVLPTIKNVLMENIDFVELKKFATNDVLREVKKYKDFEELSKDGLLSTKIVYDYLKFLLRHKSEKTVNPISDKDYLRLLTKAYRIVPSDLLQCYSRKLFDDKFKTVEIPTTSGYSNYEDFNNIGYYQYFVKANCAKDTDLGTKNLDGSTINLLKNNNHLIVIDRYAKEITQEEFEQLPIKNRTEDIITTYQEDIDNALSHNMFRNLMANNKHTNQIIDFIRHTYDDQPLVHTSLACSATIRETEGRNR